MRGAGAERERGGNTVKPKRWAELGGKLQRRCRSFSASDGAPRGLEVQRQRQATDSPSVVSHRQSWGQ